MKIGTWNVDYALESHVDDLRKRLDENPADIWVLTETHDNLQPTKHTGKISSNQRPLSEAKNGIRKGSRWVSISSHYEISAVPNFAPHDPIRTVAAMINTGGAQKWSTVIVYGTVLPEGSNEEFESAVADQAREWEFLKSRYPDALFCIVGDFNSDLGASHLFGLSSFFRSKFGPDILQPKFNALNLSCVTDKRFPPGHTLKFPPIDHIVLPTPVAASAGICSVWAGRNGDGQTVRDRVGVVVDTNLS